MRSRRRPFVPVASALLAGLLMLTAACSSSGSDSVSQSTLVAKLKKDPAFKTISAKLDPSRTNVIATCAAKGLKKDANQGDLKKYVDGDLALQDVGGKKSSTTLGADIQLCLKDATG